MEAKKTAKLMKFAGAVAVIVTALFVYNWIENMMEKRAIQKAAAITPDISLVDEENVPVV